MVATDSSERKEPTMSNDKLVEYVQDELFWDPKVDNVAIAVSADDGKITLRGTLGSLREKLEAKKAAKRVVGVKSVDNELEVKFMNDEKRDDADLRGDVLQALMLNSFVPSTIDARVDDGFVTLTGTADWQYQRDEAVYVASSVAGAVNIFDDITLKPQPSAGDVKDRIEDAFERNAKLDAKLLSVSTSNGTVTIKGDVNSWAEHDEAVAAAWSAPGVTKVDDRIAVEY
jgi:osmotically-inducible protein OsmY